jgi:hypothetical protein
MRLSLVSRLLDIACAVSLGTLFFASVASFLLPWSCLVIVVHYALQTSMACGLLRLFLRS